MVLDPNPGEIMSRALLLAALLFPLATAETPADSPDHANHFQADPVQAGDITATAKSAWGRQQEAKLKVAFTNGTDQFLVVPKDGARIVVDGAEHAAANREGLKIIDPTSEATHTFTFADPGGTLHGDSLVARLEGIGLANTEGAATVEAEPFTLPLRINKIEAGGFVCSAKGKVKQTTDNTSAKFECTYQGAPGTVGLLDSEAITVVIPDGGSFANEAGKPTQLLLPGDKLSFEVQNTVIQPKVHGVDMQFTELTLQWNDALESVELQPVEFPDWQFTLDAALTAEKNG
jgi:hypothetical protein